jgi:hypothetical protein
MIRGAAGDSDLKLNRLVVLLGAVRVGLEHADEVVDRNAAGIGGMQRGETGLVGVGVSEAFEAWPVVGAPDDERIRTADVGS